MVILEELATLLYRKFLLCVRINIVCYSVYKMASEKVKVIIEDSDTGSLTCGVCQQKYSRRRHLVRHLARVHVMDTEGKLISQEKLAKLVPRPTEQKKQRSAAATYKNPKSVEFLPSTDDSDVETVGKANIPPVIVIESNTEESKELRKPDTDSDEWEVDVTPSDEEKAKEMIKPKPSTHSKPQDKAELKQDAPWVRKPTKPKRFVPRLRQIRTELAQPIPKKVTETPHPRRNLLTRAALVQAIKETNKNSVPEIVEELSAKHCWNAQERKRFSQRVGDICVGMAEQAKAIRSLWPLQLNDKNLAKLSTDLDMVTTKALDMKVPDIDD